MDCSKYQWLLTHRNQHLQCEECLENWSTEDYAQAVCELARAGLDDGTWGVAGLLVDNASGRVIYALFNAVMRPITEGDKSRQYCYDPTAHGETYLVYWYYQHREQLQLPPPDQLTVVSSLDPCAMCSGSLLSAGFNVFVVAHDDVAGIHSRKNEGFKGMPSTVIDGFQRRFIYPEVLNHRDFYCGNPDKGELPSSFLSPISLSSVEGCKQAFLDSFDRSQQTINQSEYNPLNRNSDDDNPIHNKDFLDLFRQQYPDAYTIKVDNYRKPSNQLREHLQQLVQNTPHATNAVAYIDIFGNVVLTEVDRFDKCLISTAFANIVQNYFRIRFEFKENISTRHYADVYLAHPKYGTFVYLFAPDGKSANCLKDLGIYGSMMEGPIPVRSPSHFQYFEERHEGDVATLLAMIDGLPPFYQQSVGIYPDQVQC